MFGLNKFGDPIYKIAWAQSEFHTIGSSWFTSMGEEKIGYRQEYKGAPMPCWMILRWKEPSQYGSPGIFYLNTYLEGLDIYFLGEYPWKGRYEILYNMCHKEFRNGKLIVEALPLNHTFIDKIIPLLIESQYITAAEREAAAKLAKEYEHKKQVNEITDRMMDSLPAWYGPVSYSHQGCRTSLLDKKMAQIQKKWEQLGRHGKPVFSKGIMQGDRPIVRGRVN